MHEGKGFDGGVKRDVDGNIQNIWGMGALKDCSVKFEDEEFMSCPKVCAGGAAFDCPLMQKCYQNDRCIATKVDGMFHKVKVSLPGNGVTVYGLIDSGCSMPLCMSNDVAMHYGIGIMDSATSKRIKSDINLSDEQGNVITVTDVEVTISKNYTAGHLLIGNGLMDKATAFAFCGQDHGCMMLK